LDYWGSTIAIGQENVGTVWATQVDNQGKFDLLTFRCAIAFQAETPDALETLLGTATDALLDGFSVSTGGACASVVINGQPRVAQYDLGPININNMEGFAEQNFQSTLRNVRTSIAFEVSVKIV
jgi:hypothetical protein